MWAEDAGSEDGFFRKCRLLRNRWLPSRIIGRPTLANLSAAAPVTSKETRRTLLLQVKSTPSISVFSCLILFGHHSTFGLVLSFFCLYSTLRCRAPKPWAHHGAMHRTMLYIAGIAHRTGIATCLQQSSAKDPSHPKSRNQKTMQSTREMHLTNVSHFIG